MTAPFVRVDVTPDTPTWEEERRHTLGASEVPAVLGVSPYATPLDIYQAKFGVERTFDPELSFIGHAEELTVGRWVRRFHPELGLLRRGFMARSTETPWLHASFDRFVVRRGAWAPVQIKTAHQYAGGDWADEVPLPVRVQVQAELHVYGAPYGWAVGFVGGRRFHLHRIDRDDEFIRDVLIPETRAFWDGHVRAEIPPAPSTPAEAVRRWSGDPDHPPVIADAELLQILADYDAARHAAKSYEAGAEEYALALMKRLGDATELVDEHGRTLLTWRPRAGSRRFDTTRFREEHPELATEYTTTGAPTRTFSRKTIRQEQNR
jgi:putative phage-type endonuclease